MATEQRIRTNRIWAVIFAGAAVVSFDLDYPVLVGFFATLAILTLASVIMDIVQIRRSRQLIQDAVYAAQRSRESRKTGMNTINNMRRW